MKSLDEQFLDWESHVFGFGYGTGEEHTLGALRDFLEAMEVSEWGSIGDKYRDMEAKLGPRVAWLLINTLCHARLLEYGTSPRGAWLTANGKRLREYMLGRSLEELLDLERPDDFTPCYPDVCNCGPNGYVEGARCYNAFWCEEEPPAVEA